MKKLWKILCLIFGAFSLFSPFVSCGNASNPDGSESRSKELPADYALNNDFWDNASVYFVLTDRFYNGNSENDTFWRLRKIFWRRH